MEGWFYDLVPVVDTTEQHLNQKGAQGWELAGIIQGVLKPGANAGWLVAPTYVFKKRRA